MIKVYSEHRLNEDWFLRSKGFKQSDLPNVSMSTTSTLGRRYKAERNDRAVSVRQYHTKNGSKWVASCTGNDYQSIGFSDVVTALTVAELNNWGEQ